MFSQTKDWMRKWDNTYVIVGQAEQGRSGQQVSEVQRIKVLALVCGKQLKSKIFRTAGNCALEQFIL